MTLFGLMLLYVIPRLKYEKFKEEEEWRLIYIRLFGDADPPIKFRVGKSMLVPYIEFPLSDKDDKGERLPITTIKKIIVGPTPHKKLSLKAVESLLGKNKIKDCEVVSSEVPYRAW